MRVDRYNVAKVSVARWWVNGTLVLNILVPFWHASRLLVQKFSVKCEDGFGDLLRG